MMSSFATKSFLSVSCLAVLSLLLASSSSAQTVDESDPQVQAAIYHAAGNSTKVPSDIVITDPKQGTVWYTQGLNPISWTGADPIEFAIQIINKDASVRASGISLIANQETAAGTIDTRIGKIETGTYFVRFYNPQDTTKQFALSSDFTVELKSNKETSVAGAGAGLSNGTNVGGTTSGPNDTTPPASVVKPDESHGNATAQTGNSGVNSQTDNKMVGHTSGSTSQSSSIYSVQVQIWSFCLLPLLVTTIIS